MKVGIIGAGVAGMIAAQTLREKDVEVTVFEREAWAGGRLGTFEEEGHAFDHGSQSFQVRSAGFKKEIKKLEEMGKITIWKPKLGMIKDGQIEPYFPPEFMYVGTPSMGTLVEHWASGCEIRLQTTVTGVRNGDGNWTLELNGEQEAGPFDVVILAVPAPICAELLPGSHPFQKEVEPVATSNCWTAMAVIESAKEIPFDCAYVKNEPIMWFARNSSKPGRNADDPCWVIQANYQWSDDNVDMEPDLAADRLFNRLRALPFMGHIETKFIRGHLWKNASPKTVVKPKHLFDPELKIGCCGDWCGNVLVEGAYLSGLALGYQVLKLLK